MTSVTWWGHDDDATVFFYYNYYFLVDSHDNGQTGSTKDWPLELNSTPTACVMPGGSFGWQKSHRDCRRPAHLTIPFVSFAPPQHTSKKKKKRNREKRNDSRRGWTNSTSRHVHTRGGNTWKNPIVIITFPPFLTHLHLGWVLDNVKYKRGTPERNSFTLYFSRCRAAIRITHTQREKKVPVIDVYLDDPLTLNGLQVFTEKRNEGKR